MLSAERGWEHDGDADGNAGGSRTGTTGRTWTHGTYGTAHTGRGGDSLGLSARAPHRPTPILILPGADPAGDAGAGPGADTGARRWLMLMLTTAQRSAPRAQQRNET